MPLHVRRDPAPAHKSYRTYKKYLREDFRYRCVYCDIHENEYGGLHHFHVEHFRPFSIPRFAALKTAYANLLYACGICNKRKGDDWPSDEPLTDGRGYLDPCEHDYEHHFCPDTDQPYSVQALSEAARYMIGRLRLNRKQLQRLRERREQNQRRYEQSMHEVNVAIASVTTLMARQGADNALTELHESLIAQRKAIQSEWRMRWIPEFEAGDYR